MRALFRQPLMWLALAMALNFGASQAYAWLWPPTPLEYYGVDPLAHAFVQERPDNHSPCCASVTASPSPNEDNGGWAWEDRKGHAQHPRD